MLFRDPKVVSPFSILENLEYLEQDEGILEPRMVPMVENLRLNTILVDYCYADLVSIEEGYTIVVDEEEVVVNPKILMEYSSMVVRPISEMDSEYQFVKASYNAWLANEAFDPSKFKTGKSGHKVSHYIQNYLGGAKAINRKMNSAGVNAIYNKQSIDSALDDLKKVFGSAFDPKSIDQWELAKLLNRVGFISNASDQTLCRLVKLPNPFNRNGRKGTTQPNQPPNPSSPPTNPNGTNPPNTKKQKQPPTLQRYISKAKTAMWDNKGKISAGLALTAGAAGLYKYVSHKLEQQPKSTIGKRVAALRHIYHSWMERAQRSTDPGIAVKLRKAAATILQVIDMILSKLQNSAERAYRS